ncbi:hypothetical protein [Streptomyces anulatus]|uniref:hypothetical protein n=1 Tax=Streptomyces anulatus TaxID=1892 RepID=UPI001C27FAA7|nr:hypothetical protein [Streptomyces anulatus]
MGNRELRASIGVVGAGGLCWLALGHGRRYWVAASVMALVAAAAPLANRLWGRRHPI